MKRKIVSGKGAVANCELKFLGLKWCPVQGRDKTGYIICVLISLELFRTVVLLIE